MKQSLKRRIYYVSVIAALVIILASAVIINRTLVNTPEIEIDSISENAGEPVSAYMAYLDENGDLIIGIASEGDDDTKEIIEFVKNMEFLSEYTGESAPQGKVPDAWVALYDENDRIASRLNFYNGGAAAWHDGTKYDVDPSKMQQLIKYCNANIREEDEEQEESLQTAEETPQP